MKNLKKKIFIGLLIGMMLTPTFCFAKARSGFHSSSHSRTHISSSSSRSKISLSKPKVSSQTKLKSGTKTLRPTKGTTIPRTTKKTTVKDNTNNKKASTLKSFTIKKKSNNTKPVKINSSSYSTKPVNYTDSDLKFWRYYGIYNMLKDDDNVSERDIANALAEKGYSQSEINSILYDANKENNEKKEDTNKTNKSEKNNPVIVLMFVVAILICIGIMIYIFAK